MLLLNTDEQLSHFLQFILQSISSEHSLQPLCVCWGNFYVLLLHDLLNGQRLIGLFLLLLQYFMQVGPFVLCGGSEVKQNVAAVDFPDNFDELSVEKGV